MKRALKQNQKVQQVSKIPSKTSYSQNDLKLGFINSGPSSQSGLQKGGFVNGQVSYKRVLNDSKLLGSQSITPNHHSNSSNQNKNIGHQQSLNQSNKQHSSGSQLHNKQGGEGRLSSTVKNDLRMKYGGNQKKDRKITDLSEILAQDSNMSDSTIPLREIEVQIELKNHSQAIISTPLSSNICMFNKVSQSPISLRYASRDLNLSPQDTHVLTEQQMLLRSGISASPDHKTVIESIIVNHTNSVSSKNSNKVSPLTSGKPSPKVKSASRNKKIYSSGKHMRNSLGFINDEDIEEEFMGIDGRLVFNDITVKENSNLILNSNKKLHNTAFKQEKSGKKQSHTKQQQNLKSQLSQVQSQQNCQAKRKSPSVGEIEGAPTNLYSLKISDITDALNEFTQHEEAVNQSFKESPIDYKSQSFSRGGAENEFQTLILNQTNATSSGIISQEFTLVKASPMTSERNSFGPTEQAMKKIGVPIPIAKQENGIECLMRSILIEGRVLWEVKWKEGGKVTFESEDSLKTQNVQEFQQMKMNYLQQRDTKQ